MSANFDQGVVYVINNSEELSCASTLGSMSSSKAQNDNQRIPWSSHILSFASGNL